MNDQYMSNQHNDYQACEDAAERFERMQKELLVSDLDSMPYRQAQMKTNRRVCLQNLTNSYSNYLFCLFFKQIFDSTTAQGSWKQSPSTTVIHNSGAYNGRMFDQDQQSTPPMSMNGSRQKPMVR